MSVGRILVAALVLSAVLAGGLMYYLQVYAYYVAIAPEDAYVQLVAQSTDEPEPVAFENFKAIDSDSSPLRYRACFDIVPASSELAETYVALDTAEPRVAPGWFDCFDAAAIGADLQSGAAQAYVGQRDIVYGIDRIVAVYPDGRAYAWHEINACGEVVFDGNPTPEGCAPPPE